MSLPSMLGGVEFGSPLPPRLPWRTFRTIHTEPLSPSVTRPKTVSKFRFRVPSRLPHFLRRDPYGCLVSLHLRSNGSSVHLSVSVDQTSVAVFLKRVLPRNSIVTCNEFGSLLGTVSDGQVIPDWKEREGEGRIGTPQ